MDNSNCLLSSHLLFCAGFFNGLSECTKVVKFLFITHGKPSIIDVKIKIGKGCLAKEGIAIAHGEPLGEENVKELKRNLGLPEDKHFFVGEGIYSHIASQIETNDKECQEFILPSTIANRIVIEAGSRLSWGGYAGIYGEFITMDTFGASAPSEQLFEKFGFTVENVVSKINEYIL